MSIKVREGGKYLKLARRLGGVSSFGIYSNSTVLAFLIYYIQSVLYVIQKICVLCITIVLTQNSCCKINCVRFCENSISWITIYVINIYLKIMKLKHVWYYLDIEHIKPLLTPSVCDTLRGQILWYLMCWLQLFIQIFWW